MLSNYLQLTPNDIISLVGAGGKTTIMFRLAKELQKQSAYVLSLTTTHIFYPTLEQSQYVILEQNYDSLIHKIKLAFKKYKHITIGLNRTAENKIIGLPADWVCNIKKDLPFIDYIINEADGAKHHHFKIPADYEPVVPDCTSHYIIVLSAKVFNQPIHNKTLFRYELLETWQPAVKLKYLGEEEIAYLLLHPKGFRRIYQNKKQKIIFFINDYSHSNPPKLANLLREGVEIEGIFLSGIAEAQIIYGEANGEVYRC